MKGGSFRRVAAVLGVGLLPAFLAAEPAHRYADETVVVANSNDPDSVALAEFYQAFRGLPADHLIALPMPTGRDVTQAQYVSEILNPLRLELLTRGIIDGDFIGPPDALGRRPMLWVRNAVRYMVLCRGVPLRIQGSNSGADAALEERYLAQLRRSLGDPDFSFPEQFDTARASVDSELALLALNDTPMSGIVLNPLRGKAPERAGAPIIRVARLDGPSDAVVRAMLEGVRQVERNGLRGRAYFDVRGIAEGQPLRVGDDWIRGAAEAVEELHFDLELDEAGGTLGVLDRLDSPAIYFGWYRGHANEPFTYPDFRFAPGALAFHIHSFSAADPQNPARHWVGPLLAAGASATLGNVHEPFLGQTHQLDVLMRVLVAGYNFGDAAYAAAPSLSWQWAIFGDPLYEPFKVSHDEMMPAARRGEDPALDPFVIMREMNRLLAAGEEREARRLGGFMLERLPHAALALKVARLEQAADEEEQARRRLMPFAETAAIAPQDRMLFFEIGRTLEAMEASAAATSIFGHLLADEGIPRELEKALLKEGSAAALWVETALSETWKERLEAIREEERRAREEAEARRQAEEAAKQAAAAQAEAAEPES